MKLDGFLLALLGAVFLAWLYPELGASGGPLYPEVLVKVGIAVIFFFQGLLLPLTALRQGTAFWRVHLLVVGTTFLLFPMMGIALLQVIPNSLQQGVFFLCALPSTVTSAVALTASARGHVAAAMFNATLSSLLALVLTPFWMSVVGQVSGDSLPLVGVLGDLLVALVLPMTLGQLLRPRLGAWALRNKKRVQRMDRGVILLLVYTSFCKSMLVGAFANQTLSAWVALFCVVAGLLGASMLLLTLLAQLFKLPKAQRVTVLFCGSHKSLALGVPLASLLFGNGAGAALLPIMIYHPLQLLVGGVLVSGWAKVTPPE